MYPFLKHHVNTWPVTDIIHRYLSNHRKYEIAKQRRIEQGMGNPNPNNNGGAAPAPTNLAGGVGDDSDVELSD